MPAPKAREYLASLKTQEKKKQIELIVRVNIMVARFSFKKAGISISPGKRAALVTMPAAVFKASRATTLIAMKRAWVMIIFALVLGVANR